MKFVLTQGLELLSVEGGKGAGTCGGVQNPTAMTWGASGGLPHLVCFFFSFYVFGFLREKQAPL